MNSINHPWGISDKFKKRYGKIWSEMDFEVAKLSNYHFKNDPMNTIVGTVSLCGQQISMKYKHLISSANSIQEYAQAAYFEKADKDTKFAIEFANKTFILKKHEIGKLAQTLSDSLHTINVGYQIGSYL